MDRLKEEFKIGASSHKSLFSVTTEALTGHILIYIVATRFLDILGIYNINYTP